MKGKLIGTGLLTLGIAANAGAQLSKDKDFETLEEGYLETEIIAEQSPAKAKPAEKEKINSYSSQMAFGNNPRTFFIGADGKIHFGKENSAASIFFS